MHVPLMYVNTFNLLKTEIRVMWAERKVAENKERQKPLRPTKRRNEIKQDEHCATTYRCIS